MGFSLKKLTKQIGKDVVDAFNYPKRFKRFSKDLRNLSRTLRGKSKSNPTSSSLNSQSSARYLVGNTGFHRSYNSLGVRGAYAK